MSDNWLIILPVDPFHMPSEERQAAAVALLREMRPDAGEISLEVSDQPAYFHIGSNFEGVFCPFCEADLMDWWPDELARWSKTRRHSLDCTTPCCGRETTLDDLIYDLPQGFARFGIELMNP